MAQEIKTVYYCENCGAWVGTNQICPECHNKTVPKELPKRRDNYYFIRGIDEPLPSVTTILNVIHKPQLIYWAAETAAKAALRDPSLTAKEAVSAVYQTRDRAAMKGGDIHKIIAKDKYDKTKMDKRVLGYIESYEKFKNSIPHKVLLSEEVVYSKEHKYAGTLDCLAQLSDNKIWLLDFKTGKGIYPLELSLQLSAYKKALGKKIDHMAGIHLKPDKTFSLVEVKDNFDIFLAAQKLWLYKNQE